MKKIKSILITLSVCAFILTSIQCAAQNRPKHEISAGYGVFTVNEFASFFGTPIVSLGLVSTEVKNSIGAINIAYGYRLSKVVSIGGTYTYSRYTENLFLLRQLTGSAVNTFHSIMPTAKFNWLNSKIVTLYSKVAVGVTIGTITPEYHNGSNIESSGSVTSAIFGFQVTPIGIEIGRKVAFFAEAGIGSMGTAVAGARVRF